MDSTTVGGRPWSAWNAAASTLRRASIATRRVDQRAFSRGSTPTTSRIGRLPRSVPGRSAKTQAEAGPQVLLQGRVVRLGGGHVGLEQDPPIDREPLPGQRLHLVRHRDVGVQVGVPGPGVAVRERGRDQPGDVDLTDPVGALPRVQGVRLDEPQRVGDGVAVGELDLRRDLRRGDRPQRAHGLDGGEGQVVPADRGRPRPRVFGDGPGQLAGVDRVPVVFVAEELQRDLGADPGPVRCVERGSRAGAPGRRRGPRCAWRPRPGTR